jgi:hypothetical protein
MKSSIELTPDQTNAAPESSTPELVEVHLRADKNLSPEAAKALAQMFKAIYEQVSIPVPRSAAAMDDKNRQKNSHQ